MTDEFGPVSLHNSQVDKKGYYTISKITYKCTNCLKHLEKSNNCDHCGSTEVDIKGVGEYEDNEYILLPPERHPFGLN